MADERRTWALKLRDGTESWSMDVDGDTVATSACPTQASSLWRRTATPAAPCARTLG